MTGGNIYSIGEAEKDNTFYFPYAEVTFAKKDGTETSFNGGFYLRYYFNDTDQIYNKFAVGLKYMW